MCVACLLAPCLLPLSLPSLLCHCLPVCILRLPRLGYIVALGQMCVCVCVFAKLLFCGKSCRLLLLHCVSRNSFWNVSFPHPSLSSLQTNCRNYPPSLVKIKKCFWKSPQSSMGSPWCPKCFYVVKGHKMFPFRTAFGTISEGNLEPNSF